MQTLVNIRSGILEAHPLILRIRYQREAGSGRK